MRVRGVAVQAFSGSRYAVGFLLVRILLLSPVLKPTLIALPPGVQVWDSFFACVFAVTWWLSTRKLQRIVAEANR